ncbi:hypothetical protein [uncultured Kingella sp.]|jgi:hypothetical protein|uniref:hypothetical protein n=1 Tax=Kingella oralis TaxID=505 RepID=UPI002598BD43|nr:hypothetical protein [uncultured Kingella sp.]
MTRDRESAWSEQALDEYDAAIRQKYRIADSDSNGVREQKAAAFCRGERTTMEKQMKRWFNNHTPRQPETTPNSIFRLPLDPTPE